MLDLEAVRPRSGIWDKKNEPYPGIFGSIDYYVEYSNNPINDELSSYKIYL